jgi:hypothetical protein
VTVNWERMDELPFSSVHFPLTVYKKSCISATFPWLTLSIMLLIFPLFAMQLRQRANTIPESWGRPVREEMRKTVANLIL